MSYSSDHSVVYFDSSAELFRAVAEELSSKLEARFARGEKLYLAVSGGNSPVPLFKLFASEYKHLKWESLELFWVDERMVPADHQESNYGNAKRLWLDHLPEEVSGIHFINGAADEKKEAERYGEEILKILPEKRGLPVFDWIWLGIGNDGHTASLFPGADINDYKNITGTAEHPETNQKRITLTASIINNANEILFIVPGNDKMEIVESILKKKDLTLPAASVKPVSGSLKWYLNR